MNTAVCVRNTTIFIRSTSSTSWPGNLALACHQCNLHKGTNLASFDPDTNKVVRLFHPRQDRCEDHFAFDGPRIAGLTAIGRTTAWLLQMNSEERIELRRVLLELDELS